MNFRQMEYMIAVAQEGNITRAAQKLRIAQPSLSQTIHTVEEELGAPIFRRRSQPMIPTDLGERYLEVAKKILRLRDDFLNETREINEGYAGKIIVGISLRRSREIIADILMEITRRMPNLEILLVHEKSTALEKMLLKGEVDVAFMHYRSLQPQIESRYLCNEELLLGISPDSPVLDRLRSYPSFTAEHPDCTPIPPYLLQDVQWVLLKEGHVTRSQFDQIFRDAGISPRIYMETENTELAADIARATGICTILPHVVKARNYETSGLLTYRLDSPNARRGFYLAYNSLHYVSKSLKNFLAISENLLR